MSEPIAMVDATGQRVTLRHATWGITIPAADLPRWIDLYRSLADRKNPRTGEPRAYAAHYAPMLKAMTRAQRIIDLQVPRVS
jgi:hypothetical protein